MCVGREKSNITSRVDKRRRERICERERERDPGNFLYIYINIENHDGNEGGGDGEFGSSEISAEEGDQRGRRSV